MNALEIPAVKYTVGLLRSRIPIVITSTFRPTGTHMFAAVDAAPRFQPGLGLHHLGIDGCQLSDMYDLLRQIGPSVPHGTQIYMEKDHFHIHSLNHLPNHLRTQLPVGRAFAEITPRCMRDMGCKGGGGERIFLRITE